MNLRNISAWSIRNPVAPLVVFVGLLLAGIVAFMGMEVQDNPDIEFPMVIATISQPGAAPSEITKQVTEKVESAVQTIGGVRSINSEVSEGISVTMVEFEIGEDVNQAVNEVKNAVDQVRSDLPDGILEPQVLKQTTTSQPIAYFAVSVTDMTLEQLSWFVDDEISNRLLSLEGMADVTRIGGLDREIRVVLNPMRMQALGITANEVNSVLRQVNIDTTGGEARIAGSRQSVRVLGNADSAFDLANTEITLSGGRTVYLRDFANVEDSFSEQTVIAEHKGKQVVVFSMSRAKGASDVSVFDLAEKEMAAIEAENPGIEFIELFNNVHYTADQYHSSMAAMIEGAILAVVVVFFFLRDWRATIISAVAIPLSAIPTFWFMDLMGFTLNTMSLLALSLVAGVLVDDAIVEIENIVRHMRMGKSAYQASIDAADEIGLAVVATTFSIVAVFLPVGLMPGVSGQFFKNFGLTVVAAVLMSLAVARMITPLLAAYFLKAHGEAEHGGGRIMDRYLALLKWTLRRDRGRQSSRGLARRIYGRLRNDHRFVPVGVGLLAFLLTVGLMLKMPQQFFPDINVNSSRIEFHMLPGTTVEQTHEVGKQILAIAEAQPESQEVLMRVSEGNGAVFITLSEERDRSSIQFERDLAPQLAEIADARVSFQAINNQDGGTGRDITVMLTGSDAELLDRAAGDLVEQMRGISLIRSPRIEANFKRPELIIEPDFEIAAQLGVTTLAISQAIRVATIGEIDQNSAKFSLDDRQVPIRVMLPKAARGDLSNIENLPVATSNGGSVPLSRVADIRFGSGPTTIQRRNQSTRVFIGADLAPGVVKSEAQAAIDALPAMRDLPIGIRTAPVGADEWQAEMIYNFIVAVVSGVLLVFGVLVLLYKRLMSPLVNMTSLLLAPLGGLLALLLLGMPISMPVYIGILMLLGIVAKNSILLVDFALEEMARGVPKYEAIIEAASKRAQPIVMTTVAMTAGMVPSAISLTGDGAWRAPMGVTVIGGLLLSTLLTLMIVPAGFSLADSFEKWVGPKLSRLMTYKPEHRYGGSADPQAAE